MKLKNRIKRIFLAMICIVSLLVTNFSPFADNLAIATTEEEGYKEMTFKDFGIYPGNTSSGAIGTSDEITTLDGVAVSGRVKFGTSWLMMGHESAERSDWSGIQMFVDEDGKSLKVSSTLFAIEALTQFQVGTGAGSSSSVTDEGYVKVDFDGTGSWCDIGFSSITADSEIHVFMNNDSDYPRYVQMNWTKASKVIDENGIDITESVNTESATKLPANSGWVEVIYPRTEGTQFNCISRETEDGKSVGSLLLKGYYVDERTEKAYGFPPSSAQVSSEEAGVDFANEYVDLRLTFDYTESGVDMGVNVNGNFIKSISFADSSDGAYNIKECLGKYVKVTDGFAYEGNYRELTYKDWGMTDAVYSDGTVYSLTDGAVTSLDGVAFNGIIEVEDKIAFYLGGQSGWDGILFHIQPANNILAINSNHITGDGFGDNIALGSTSFKLRLTFDYYGENNLLVGVYIDDTYIKTIDFNNGITDKLGTKLLIYQTGSAADLRDVVNGEPVYQELTFADFGMVTGTISGSHIGTSSGLKSLDEVAVSGKVKFGSGWLILGHESETNNEWTGIQMLVDEDGKSLKVANTLYAGGPLTQLGIGSVIADNTSTTAGTVTTTEEGYTKVDFDGVSTGWCSVDFSSGISATSEIHMFIKNDSPSARYVQLNWTGASKVLDENGNDVTSTINTTNGETRLPENSGWYEVIYPVTSGSQFNCYSRGDGSIAEGSIWIKGYYVDKGVKHSFSTDSKQIGTDETGVDFANEYADLRLTFDYIKTGVAMGVYVNDSFVKTINFGDSLSYEGYNIKDWFGKYIMATDGFSYIQELPEEDAKTILENAGYKKVNVSDFGTMGYKTYTSTEGHQLGEYAWADTLNKTYLDLNVTFNTTSTSDGYIRYGSSDGWHCVNISSDGTTLTVGLESISPMVTILPQQVGLDDFDNVNIKIALDCGTFTSTTDENGNTYNVADYTLSMWINNRKVIDGLTKTGQTYVGTTLAVYVGAADAQITLSGTYTDKERMDASYELTDANPSYLVTGTATVLKNGVEVALSEDCAISMPGDYEVITDLTDKAIRYHQKVVLYRIGDVDLNGTAGEASDLTALEKIYTTTSFEANSAAEKAADLDNDGRVDAEDWQLMKQICSATDSATELKAVKEKYHPAAKSYDYLDNVANEKNVMPIVGYYGPYDNEGTDLLKDEYYQLVKDSGINLVSYSFNNAGGQLSTVMKTLAMAEEHKLGWFVYDESLNSAKTGVEFTDEEFAATLGRYAYFDTFLGILIADEPYYASSYNGSNDASHRMDKYTAISQRLNKYNNLTGHTNLAPEDSYIVNSLTKDYFDEYFDQYVTDFKPQVLSIDDYPFNDMNALGQADEDVTNASGYFRSLSKIREQSVENDIPFWWYVQAGGCFKDTSASNYKYNADCVATETETYWNVNTALAFGAKGIQYFTLIQPTKFYDSSQTTQLNGLLDAYGNKNAYYDYAVNINAHIANVDEVLMKAESKGVITTGGYAKTEIDEGWKENQSNVSTFKSPVITAADTSRLQSVTSNDSTYGTLVGCFNYRDTEAYYVMNYNVTAGTSQTVTLTFDAEYNYRVIQQGQSAYSVIDSGCELTIPAGEAVLIVLDGISGDANGDGAFDSRDLVRHKRVEAQEARLDFVQGYVADLNGDNVIDEIDIAWIRYYLAFEKFGVN